MITENTSLQPYNTFGLDAKAKYYAPFHSVDELRSLIDKNRDKELMILGGGSNILLTQDVDKLVLRNELKGIEVIEESAEDVFVKSMGGEVWHDLVLFCIEKGYGGIENLSLIPGSVGAAPMQNIGAYGVEIKDVFQSLEALEIETGEIKTFDTEACAFGYRESVFKRSLKGKYVILSMTLKLSKNPKVNTSYGAIQQELEKMGVSAPSIQDVSNAVIRIRQSKLPDPKEIGNSGSFFKNPVVSQEKFQALQEKFPDIANYPLEDGQVKLAAGWLIDKAGWKGKTFDNYGVHKKQALVLVNYGGAKGSDIYQLSEDILQSIKSIYGIELEREVNII